MHWFVLSQTVSKEPHEGNEEEFFSHSRDFSRCPSMHLQHNEKKYHVQFAKDFEVSNGSRLSTHNRQGLPTERTPSKNLESLFSKENSTIQGRSSDALTSDIHRESKKHQWLWSKTSFSHSSVSTFDDICVERISSKCNTKDSSWPKYFFNQSSPSSATKNNATQWFSLESIDGFINKTAMIVLDYGLHSRSLLTG